MIRTVSRNFVPAAVNQAKYHGLPVEEWDESGRLMQRLRSGRDQYQGIWMVTPEGKTLSAFQDLPPGVPNYPWNMTSGVQKAIHEALAKTGPLPPRTAQARPLSLDRGLGMRDDGSARLAVTIRMTHGPDPYGDPTLDSVVLGTEALQALAPPSRTPGAQYRIREPVVRQLSRALSPISDASNTFRPQDVTEAEMVGNVVSATDQGTTVRLTGRLKATRQYTDDPKNAIHGWANAEGLAVFDAQGQLQEVILLTDGGYRYAPPHHEPEMGTASVLEWCRETRAPLSIR